MKSGLSWNLRGVDQGTREAVIEAARRSGLTVGQWLNSVLADDGVEHDEPDDIPTTASDGDTRDAAELAMAIEKVTKRLGALDDAARASIPRLKDRLDEIETRVGELSDADLDMSTQRTLLTRVSTLIDTLATDIELAGGSIREAEPRSPAIDLDRVTEALSDLDRRISDMGRRVSPPLPPVEIKPLRLDDIRDRLDALLAQTPRSQPPAQSAAIDSALKALESRIDVAKAQLEARLAEPEAPAEAQSATTHQN
jgi:localization factor PodJL